MSDGKRHDGAETPEGRIVRLVTGAPVHRELGAEWNAAANEPKSHPSDAEQPQGGKPRTSAARRNSSRGKPAWFKKCAFDDRGRPYANVANVSLALSSDERLAQVFAFDEMGQAIQVMGKIPGVDEESADPRHMRDVYVVAVQKYLQQWLPKISREVVSDAIDFRAWNCRFNPLIDYLESLRWDGVSRVKGFLSVYLGAEWSPYTETVSTCFWVAMIARNYKPGRKFDYLLVLEGEQGAGKSTACKIIGGEYFSDALPDVRFGKDVSQHLRGKLLIEIGELSSLSKASNAELKHFLTRTIERYRPSYGRREVVEPRRCMFIATTNESRYLRDETGGRRYWPIKTGKIELGALARDRDQLFAEAVHLYNSGVKWWPNADFEKDHMRSQQEDRFEADAWEEIIARAIDKGRMSIDQNGGEHYAGAYDRITISQVAKDFLGFAASKIGTADQRRIAAVLHRLGWERGERESGARWWVKNDGF